MTEERTGRPRGTHRTPPSGSFGIAESNHAIAQEIARQLRGRGGTAREMLAASLDLLAASFALAAREGPSRPGEAARAADIDRLRELLARARALGVQC